jgi:PAS domain S-box-containing protein
VLALLDQGSVQIGVAVDGPTGRLRQIVIPVEQTKLRGVFLAFCPEEICKDIAFLRHLEFMSEGLKDALCTLQTRHELSEIKASHQAGMESIPQGLVLNNENDLGNSDLERMANNLEGCVLFRTVHYPDGSRRCIWISHQVQQLFGVSREDVLRDATVLDRLIMPEDVANLRVKQIEALRSLSAYSAFLRVILDHGNIRWFNLRGTPTIEADGSVVWDSFAMDLTALELNRQELARSEFMLRQLGDNLPNGAIIQGEFDSDGREKVVFASAGFEELTGVSKEALVRDGHLPVDRILPDDLPKYFEAKNKALVSMSTFDTELRVLGRNDVVRWLRIRFAPYQMPHGVVGFNGILLDVSEQKLAVEALRSSEELFRGAFDGSATGIALAGLDHRFFRVNQAFCDILGYTETELLSKSFMEISYPEEELEANAPQSIRLWSGEVKQLLFEKRYVHKEGRAVWVNMNLSVMRNSEGLALYAIAQIQDITPRKKMEEALRLSEERYRTVLETQTDIVSRSLPDGKISFVNDVYCQFMGLKRENVVGHRWAPVVFAEDIDQVENELERICPENPIVVTTNRVLNAHGAVRWLEFVTQGIFDKSGILLELQSVGRDVTERVKSQKQLHETVQRLKLATEAGGIGTWSWNFSDNHLEWDEKLLEWYDLPESLRATGPDYDFWKSRVHPDDFAETERSFLDAIEKDIAWKHHFRVVRRDGRTIYLDTAALIEHDTNGKQIRMIGINRDVTAEREDSEALNSAKQLAEAANLAKSEFLANMSHEVRSPLTAVLGYTEMLMDPKVSLEIVSQAVHSIQRNGAHLLAMLDDILDLAKVESGKLDIERIRYSPWLLVQEVDSLLKVRAEERKIRIQSRSIGSIPSIVEMDPTRVRQILVNLLSNAVKFSDHDGLVEIRLSVKPTNNLGQVELTLEVEDQGIGMTPDQLKLIFQPFRQADSSTTRKFGGTGLGLSITSRMVKLLGGEIHVRSEIGRGSCFAVTLPMTIPITDKAEQWLTPEQLALKKSVKPSASLPTSMPSPQLKGRILLAEDNEDNRRVMTFMLGRMGLKPEFAMNGHEAFQAATAEPFDLILMDMQMPVLDGYASTQALRKSGYKGKIVALTAHSMSEDREKCLQVGCNDYLAKPISVQKLTETIARMLASSVS